MAVAASTSIPWEQDAPAGEPRLELIDEHFPLLFLGCGGDLLPQQALQLIRFVDDARARAARDECELLVICDARSATRPSDLVRDMLVDWLRHGDFGAPSQLGSIIVTQNLLMRGAIASIKWATKRGDQMHVVQTPEEALLLARKRFEDQGLTPPAVLLDDDE
jgi:hypothetical protein